MGGWQGLDESVDRGPLAITFHGSGKVAGRELPAARPRTSDSCPALVVCGCVYT